MKTDVPLKTLLQNMFDRVFGVRSGQIGAAGAACSESVTYRWHRDSDVAHDAACAEDAGWLCDAVSGAPS